MLKQKLISFVTYKKGRNDICSKMQNEDIRNDIVEMMRCKLTLSLE